MMYSTLLPLDSHHGGVRCPQTTSRRRSQKRPYSSRPFFMTLLCVSIIVAVAILRDATGSKTLRGGNLQARELSPFSKDNLSGDCHLVHDDRVTDKCAFVRAHCPDEEAGMLSYLDLYFCKMHKVKPIAFVIIILWLATLFNTLRIAASDFFVENLQTIAIMFNMSDALAGVTLLAFGNGSPDVFSTFAAMGTNSGSLAVGELIGAAGFITAVVAGGMALTTPFIIDNRKAFVREVGFFIVAAAFSLNFLRDGRLHLWECAVMVGYYLFYVLVVAIWHWRGHKKRVRKQRDEDSRSHFADREGAVGLRTPQNDQDPETNGQTRGRGVSEVSLTRLQTTGEDTESFVSVKRQSVLATFSQARSKSYVRSPSQPRASQDEIPLNERNRHPEQAALLEPQSRHRAKSENDINKTAPWKDLVFARGNDTLQVPTYGPFSSGGTSPSSASSTPPMSRRGSETSNLDDPVNAQPVLDQSAVSTGNSPEAHSRPSLTLDIPSSQQNHNALLHVISPADLTLSTLFPTLFEWDEDTWWQKLIKIVSVPSVFLLMITVPVIKTEPRPKDLEDEEGDEPTEALHPRSESQSSQVLLGASNTPISISAEPYRDNPSETQSNDGVGNQDHYETLGRYHHEQVATTPLSRPRSIRSAQGPPSPNTSDRKKLYWNRWLFIIQIFAAPVLIVLLSWATTSESNAKALIQPTLISLLCSFVALLAILKTTTAHRTPRWHHGLCYLGFVVGIAWISTIANEVVGVLKWLGVVLDISDAILGLTIFAIGNSVGDLASNTAVAQKERPGLALTACFAGPMLNILLGIGVSGGWMTIKGARHHQKKHPGSDLKFKPYGLEISSTLLISGATLLITLLGFLIIVPRRRWAMDRAVGWTLIGLWVLSTSINVLAEVMGWHRDIR